MATNLKFLSLNQVCELTSLSRTAINKWRAQGRFPQKIDLGERRVAFHRDEIRQWMEDRLAARNGV